MQEPSKPSFFSSLFTSVLTRKEIIDALQDEFNKGILSTNIKNFIENIILPFLRITADEPRHLSKIVKAIFNVIYYFEGPDYRITFTAEYQWANPKPVLPIYPSEKQECARWKPLYEQWFAQAKPYETTSKDTINAAKNVDFSTFESCLLAAIPADGTVFVPNALSLAKLQTLAKKYDIIPKIS